MDQVKEVKMISSQNINLKYFEMIVEVGGEEKKLELTASDLSQTEPDGAIDNIVIVCGKDKLGVLSEGVIYVAVDSNGDGKIDTNDFSWKAIQLVKQHFGINSTDEDPYKEGIKAPKK